MTTAATPEDQTDRPNLQSQADIVFNHFAELPKSCSGSFSREGYGSAETAVSPLHELGGGFRVLPSACCAEIAELLRMVNPRLRPPARPAGI